MYKKIYFKCVFNFKFTFVRMGKRKWDIFLGYTHLVDLCHHVCQVSLHV